MLSEGDSTERYNYQLRLSQDWNEDQIQMTISQPIIPVMPRFPQHNSAAGLLPAPSARTCKLHTICILTLSLGHQWHSWSSHLQQTQRTPSCHPWLQAWRWESAYKAAAHAETQWSVFLSSVSAQSGYGIFHWKTWRKSLWQCPIPPCQNHTSEFSHWPQAIVLVFTPLLPSLKGSFLAFLGVALAEALWASCTRLTLHREQLWQSAGPLTSREWNVAPVHKCPHLRWSLCNSYKQSTRGDTCIRQPPTDRKRSSLGGPKPSAHAASALISN